MQDTLSIVYFPAAVVLGALHALEPGHSKALTASYLIGIKGTKRDSVILGLSVAATHSVVVIAICAIGLWIGNEAFTGQATEWLERGSGIVAIIIGSWMLWRRLAMQFRNRDHAHHHQTADPVTISSSTLNGEIEIVDSPIGEVMKFTAARDLHITELKVEIDRESGKTEHLTLSKSPDNPRVYLSAKTPAEPHVFSARLFSISMAEVVGFSMKEPDDDHEHDHAHMDDVAHAKAHAETLPTYVSSGERPSKTQIMVFGAAGGMICSSREKRLQDLDLVS